MTAPLLEATPAWSEAYEAARLNALADYDVLDTPREQDFDEVAQLASAICGTPISVVNLIGEGRQFFKAEVGLGVRETPLESSFCARAILEEDFLLVPDATQDPRFDCNPLVMGEPHIRFYAGALLKTNEGHPIGTVCVLDYQPRDLTPVQQQTLRVLARQVMRQLDLRRALRERDTAQAQQRILNEELSHRLKNTLAMVQSIAMQTLRGVSEREPVETFLHRIHALASAHEVLLRQSWSDAPIGALAAAVLGNLAQMDRVTLSGPEITLGPRATLSLSLLLHELGTNATKYGALSNETGRVSVTWRLDGLDGAADVVLDWREVDGPKVSEPSRRGFGSRLIRMGLVGTGGVELCYPASGFRARMRAPLVQLQQS